MEYTSFEGMTFTDEDIKSWAKDAEAGFPDSELTWGKGRLWEGLRETAENWDTSDLIRRDHFEKKL